MNNSLIYIKKTFLILLLIPLFFQNNIPIAHASTTKTLTVTFDATPTPASVSVKKAALKYNKDFALSYTFDDGYVEGYNPVFSYLNGGYVNELNQISNGLYFSNGDGYKVPFKAGFNWFSDSYSNYNDLHIDAAGNMTWDNLREVYTQGWEPINHGWTSIGTPNPIDTIINYPASHGGPRTIDYDYEVTQNTVRMLEELGATIKHFGLPNADQNYLPAALANGMKSISAGQPSPMDNEALMDVANTLNLDQLQYKRKYFADQSTFDDMKTYIDKIANDSTNGSHYWGVAASHRVRTPVANPDNGNLAWSTFKDFMDYTSNTYGFEGGDNIWVASVPEVYEYLAVKQKTNITTDLVDSTLTITLDTSLVDTDLRRYALSLLIEADSDISSIIYDGVEFSGYSDNKTTGLINLEWGDIFLANDMTRAEEFVASSELSRVQADVETARSYVNLLDEGSEKDGLLDRLDSIEIKLKSWRISFGHNANVSGAWNEYNGYLVSSPILELKDSDNVASPLTLNIHQSFFSKIDNGTLANPTNTGYFPDAYLKGYIRMYSDSTNTTPGVVRIAGLDVNKKYKIVLLGDIPNVDATLDKTKTIYSINNINKELQNSQNTTNVVTYEGISPDVNGNIDISVGKKFPQWGLAAINALEIQEEKQLVVNYLAGSHGSIDGQDVQTVSENASTTEVTAVPDSGYYFVDWSDGLLTASRSDINITESQSLTARFALIVSGLSYSSPVVFTVNKEISPLNPTVSGLGINYSVSPELPSGLVIDTLTGVISGTPLSDSIVGPYIITATNAGGDTNFELVITVEKEEVIKNDSTEKKSSASRVRRTVAVVSELAQKTVSSGSEKTALSEVKSLTQNLKKGMNNNDVKILQLFLIQQDKGSQAKILSSYGGTNIFGSITQSALAEWQGSQGLSPDGIFGPATRAKIASLEPMVGTAEGSSSENIDESLSQKNDLQITQMLRKGMRNNEVKALQLYLNSRSYDVGIPDGIFGVRTDEAIKEFQKDNNLDVDGIVGLRTRELINN